MKFEEFNEEFIKKLNEINNTCSKNESEKLFKYMNIFSYVRL